MPLAVQREQAHLAISCLPLAWNEVHAFLVPFPFYISLDFLVERERERERETFLSIV